MNHRTVYFIQDSVSGKYISNRSHLAQGEFADAVIHTTLKSVIAGVKSRCTSMRNRILSKWAGDSSYAIERQNLPNFGFEVVSATLNDSIGVQPVEIPISKKKI